MGNLSKVNTTSLIFFKRRKGIPPVFPLRNGTVFYATFSACNVLLYITFQPTLKTKKSSLSIVKKLAPKGWYLNALMPPTFREEVRNS